MKKQISHPYNINSISELHRILALPKPEHPFFLLKTGGLPIMLPFKISNQQALYSGSRKTEAAIGD